MSGTGTPPNIGGGGGILGGWRVWVSIALVFAAGLAVFMLLSMWQGREEPPPQRHRPPPGGGASEFPTIPLPRPPPVPVVARPPEPVVLPVPQVHRRRPIPSAMALYNDPEPPRAPERPRPVAAGAVDQGNMTLAGMPVLRPDVVPDPAWWLMPGDKIACLNREPITARTGADWSAEVPEDVRSSTDGSKTLIPRGSIVVGKVVRGMQHGEMRLAAIITHVRTSAAPGRPVLMVPMGDAAAGDAMGQVDLEGNVNTHFWSRLGAVAAYAALDMLSQAGGAVAGAAISDGLRGATGRGSSVGIYSFNGVGRSLAGSEYQRQMSQGPTFERPQGQACTVFVQRPLDFRVMRRFQ